MKICLFILIFSCISFGEELTPGYYILYNPSYYKSLGYEVVWVPPDNSPYADKNNSDKLYFVSRPDLQSNESDLYKYKYNITPWENNNIEYKNQIFEMAFSKNQKRVYGFLEVGVVYNSPFDLFQMRQRGPLNERAFWMTYSMPTATMDFFDFTKIHPYNTYYRDQLAFLIDDANELNPKIKDKIGEIKLPARKSYPIDKLIEKLGIHTASPYYATFVFNLFINYIIIDIFQNESKSDITKLKSIELFTVENIVKFTNITSRNDRNIVDFILNNSELLLNPQKIFENKNINIILEAIYENKNKNVFINKKFDKYISNNPILKNKNATTQEMDQYQLKLDKLVRTYYSIIDGEKLTQINEKLSLELYSKSVYNVSEKDNNKSRSCKNIF